MTDADLKKLRAIAEGATPGPWRPSASRTGVVSAVDQDWVCTVNRITPVLDVEFIAAARIAIPELIEEIQGLRAPEAHWTCQQRIDDLEAALTAARTALAEAIYIFEMTWCPEFGHAPKPEQLERMEQLRQLVADEVKKIYEEKSRKSP